MSLFDYQATRPDGNEASGRIKAASSDDARRKLTAEGLTVRQLTLVAESMGSVPRRPLSANESEQVATHLAQFGATGLPLEAGLRAAAAELDNPRVSDALNDIANQLGQGTTLEAALAQAHSQLPGHVSGLVSAAARTGRLAGALVELLEHQHQASSLRRDVLRGFAYPLFVLGVAFAVIFGILFGISGTFQEMFNDFELHLPAPTKRLFWWRDIGVWILVTCVAVGIAFAMVMRQSMGKIAWLQMISTLPLVGRISFWAGLADWTGLMSVLVHHDVPLPEALRLSAGGVRNAYVGSIVDSLAKSAERGKSFSDVLAASPHVPASLVPVIRWGERTGSLSDAFSTTRELLCRRVRVRALLLTTILPPMLFTLIVCLVGATVMALFMPLISLIQGLS